jgi:hypothetical protein
MAITERFCANHPQRPAIGVCVMTHKPMCGECSTRYEGVNYSKEGLRLLQQQRAEAKRAGRGGRRRAVISGIVWCLSPALLYLMYLGFLTVADVLMSMLHREL